MTDMKRLIIQFDSCTSMLKANASFLHGNDFAGLGMVHPLAPQFGDAINTIPRWMRREIYRWSGWLDALKTGELKEIEGEKVSEWAASFYPERQYGGVMVGSSNGAAVHLGAALGIPWLPQTFLTAARRDHDPDQPMKDVEWGRKAIKPFLDANPDWEAHQMNDPLQDRLMITKMGYFRIKRLKLGQGYENFIRRNVTTGGRLLTVECQNTWPKYPVQDRHTFQIGGFGGITSLEYLEGSQRVRDFLKKVGSNVEKWETFKPGNEQPEAEWGFAESLLKDSRRFAAEAGYRLERLVFKEPEFLSPFIADLYIWWYKRRGLPTHRLFMENFALLDPYWTLKTGSIPLWLAFNTDPSTEMAKQYLDHHSAGFDEIFAMVMSNGVPDGIGLTSICEWKKILSKAKKRGEFLGVNDKEYPMDFGNFLKAHPDLKKKITDRFDFPQPLTWEELEQFFSETKGRYKVEWIREQPQLSPVTPRQWPF